LKKKIPALTQNTIEFHNPIRDLIPLFIFTTYRDQCSLSAMRFVRMREEAGQRKESR
jgi:hypothetical protein